MYQLFTVPTIVEWRESSDINGTDKDMKRLMKWYIVMKTEIDNFLLVSKW